MIPHIPFIQRDIHAAFLPFVRLDGVADGGCTFHHIGQRIRRAHEFGAVAVAVAKIAVDGEVVGQMVARLESLPPPCHVTEAVGDDMNGRIGPFHDFRRLQRDARIFVRCFHADLPTAAHLVAEPPIFNIKWLFRTVLATQIAPIRAAWMVAVFDKITGLFWTTRAQIHRQIRFRTDFAAPCHEFMQAELIRLDRSPRKFQPCWTVFFRANGIFPFVA